MHTFSTLMGFALAGVSAVQAHMQLEWPPALNALNNPHRSGEGDSRYVYPYGCCGEPDPGLCRGYLGLIGTPEGASVATFEAGSKAMFNITGAPDITGNDLGSTHYGGSCQVGFSTDGGKSFHVAASYIGNCPHRQSDEGSSQDFHFTVPDDIPAGDAVFFWTWINREQEFNMNCAAVTIVNSGYSSKTRSLSSAIEPSTPVGVQTPTTPLPAVGTPSSIDAAPTPSADASDSKKVALEWCSCECDSSADSTDEKNAYDADGCTCRCWKAPKPIAGRSTEQRMARHVHNRAVSNFFSRHIGFGPSAKKVEVKRDDAAVAWNKRPEPFYPNPVWHDCSVPKTDAEMQFPDPGPDVHKGDGEYPLALPDTSCKGGDDN